MLNESACSSPEATRSPRATPQPDETLLVGNAERAPVADEEAAEQERAAGQVEPDRDGAVKGAPSSRPSRSEQIAVAPAMVTSSVKKRRAAAAASRPYPAATACSSARRISSPDIGRAPSG